MSQTFDALGGRLPAHTHYGKEPRIRSYEFSKIAQRGLIRDGLLDGDNTGRARKPWFWDIVGTSRRAHTG